MPQKPETLFREKVTPLLKALPNTFVISVQQQALRGTPDHLLCCNGFFVALEYKKDGKSKPSAIQRWSLEKIKKAGGLALVVFPGNWDTVYRLLGKVATRPVDLR